MGIGAALSQELAFVLPDSIEFARIVIRLFMAVVLGGLLGFQRAEAGKPAGMRTHMLVALGAAMVVLLPQLIAMTSADTSRIIQGTLTGIGFIGGGVILKLSEQHQIIGITTAASIWLTATVGIAAGAGRLSLAVAGTILAFLILVLCGRFEKWVIRRYPYQKN